MAISATNKVYEDKDTGPLSATLTTTHAVTGVESTSGSFGGRQITYRAGRRRPKPKFLDSTPYELYKLDARPIRGDWTQQDPRQSNPTKYRGSASGDNSRVTTMAKARYSNNGGRSVFDTNLQDLSYLNALKKMNYKDIDLGTAFKEWGKTAQLVGDLAHLSVDLVRAARRRDARGFMQRLTGDASHRLPAGQNVVDGYLAYHYGVKPTLQDIAGLVQTMTRLAPEHWRVRSVGSAEDRRRKSGSFTDAFPLFLSYNASVLDSCRTQIFATRKAITRADDLRWALGLDDSLSTAWELTPFSFVYDWAMPVGDWLASVNASKYYEDWHCSSTQYRREEVEYFGGSGTYVQTGVTKQLKSNVSGGYSALHIKRTVRNRLPMTTIPIKNPVSVDHMAKGLSLLASTLARGGEVPRFLKY